MHGRPRVYRACGERVVFFQFRTRFRRAYKPHLQQGRPKYVNHVGVNDIENAD